MSIQRIINTTVEDEEPEELELEVTLRPRTFDDYIGQQRLKTSLKLAIDAATKRGEPIDHVLLYGPPGLGKTHLVVSVIKTLVMQYGVECKFVDFFEPRRSVDVPPNPSEIIEIAFVLIRSMLAFDTRL